MGFNSAFKMLMPCRSA